MGSILRTEEITAETGQNFVEPCFATGTGLVSLQKGFVCWDYVYSHVAGSLYNIALSMIKLPPFFSEVRKPRDRLSE